MSSVIYVSDPLLEANGGEGACGPGPPSDPRVALRTVLKQRGCEICAVRSRDMSFARAAAVVRSAPTVVAEGAALALPLTLVASRTSPRCRVIAVIRGATLPTDSQLTLLRRLEADVCVSTSGLAGLLVRDHEFAPDRVHPVGLGIDCDFFYPPDTQGEVVHCLPGLAVQESGLNRADMIAVSLVLELERQLKAADIACTISIEPLDEYQRRASFASARVVMAVMPWSRRHSGEAVVAEAAAMGRVVVALDSSVATGALQPAGPEYRVDAVEGVPAAVAIASRVFRHPDSCARVGRANRAFVVANHSSGATADCVAKRLG